MMRDFITAATTGSGGSAIASAATGQIIIAAVSAVFMIGFGFFGAYLRWKDSKALRKAIDDNDLSTALKIRSK